jgi:hypothetical protein
MATFNTVQSRVTNLVGSNVSISSTEIQQIIAAEHDTILNDNTWADRRAEAVLPLVGPYSAGTISTVGTAVTGTNTVFTALMVGRYLRVSLATQYYLITAVADTTHLTIEAAVPAGDVTNSTYTIFQTVYTLPSNCERITSIRYQLPLQDTPLQELNRIDPYRSVTSDIPFRYSYRELSSAGYRQIEVWPTPTSAVLLRFDYFKTNAPPILGVSWSNDTTSPLYRSDVLVWKSAETAAYLLFSKTGDQSWAVLSERYHNNYNESLLGAKLDDLGKNSPAHKIRDTAYRAWPLYDTSWSIDHDAQPW